ncbi:MAG TPA: hypothetical protein VNE39_10725 [Planctomycetota bacterium]|nr:hypothetical protein [Planctomycetota bacterium]
MKQTVLDGIVAIEAKAAQMVDDAKLRAGQAREKVKADLAALARQLDEQANAAAARYQADAEKKKAAALASLDRGREAAVAALERVRAERVPPMVDELLKAVEQRADGD